MKNKIQKFVVLFSAVLASGCGVTDRMGVEKSDHFSRFMNNMTFSAGTEFTDIDKIQMPREYGNHPPHPDDLYKLYGPYNPCKTREVNLRSGEYNADSFSVECSPFIDDLFENRLLENIKVGYKGTYIHTDEANNVREGLSEIAWYEYGAFAATYSRIKMTNTCHSLRFSWRQPFKLDKDGNFEIYVQPGISYDDWSGKFEAQGGWDRYYREEPRIIDSFSAKTLWNPFVKAGIIGYDGAEFFGELKRFSLGIDFFWEPERIEGETPYGPVKAEGDTWGVEAVVAF